MTKTPLRSLISIMALVATALPSMASEVDADKTQQRFQCNHDNDEGTATTLVRVGEGTNVQSYPLINWSADYFRSEEKAKKLCDEISQQLQTFHEEGKLKEISLLSGKVNEETVVCLGSSNQEECSAESNILFSMDTKENHNVALYNLLGQAFRPPENPSTRGDFSTRMNMNVFSFF